MLSTGPAKKVTIYINEDTSTQNDFLSQEIVSFLLHEGVSGATVFRPDSGYGAHRRLHTKEGGIDTDPHMPIRIEFVERPGKVESLLPALMELVTDGLIEAHDTEILKMITGTPQ